MIPQAWKDRGMPTLDELALFLGGSGTSFTGDLLRLMRKADPENRRQLERAFPREHRALTFWDLEYSEPLTMGQLDEMMAISDRPRPLSLAHECEHQASNFTPCRVCGA